MRKSIIAGIIFVLSFLFFFILIHLISNSFSKSINYYPLRIIRAILGIISIASLIYFVRHLSDGTIKTIIKGIAAFVCLFIVLETYFTFLPFYTQNHYSPLSRSWLQKYWKLNDIGVRDSNSNEHFKSDIPNMLVIGDEALLGMGINDVSKRAGDIIRKELEDCYNVSLFGKLNGNTKVAADVVKSLPVFVNTVIYIHSPDDIIGNTRFFEGLPEKERKKNPWNENSYLFDYLNERSSKDFDDYYQEILTYYADTGYVALHKNTMGDLMHYCQQRGKSLGVVMLPIIKSKALIKSSNKDMVEPMASYISNNGVPVLNLSDVLLKTKRKRRLASKYSRFPGKKAHKKMANEILQFIEDKSLLIDGCE